MPPSPLNYIMLYGSGNFICGACVESVCAVWANHDPPWFSTEKKENVIFVLTLHGGHLGFFEGAVLFPQPLTWMDKVIISYANAICHWQRQQPQCRQATDCTELKGKA